MSVVNKMLKDLEARETQPNKTHADYQPPQKQSLRFLKIAVIGLLILVSLWLLLTKLLTNTPQSSASKIVATETGITPSNTKKMPVKKTEAPEVPKHQNIENKEHELTTSKTTQDASVNPLGIQETSQSEEVASSAINTHTIDKTDNESQIIAEQQSSFAMVSSSKENKTIDLKRKIGEALANNNISQASNLLPQLIINEPNNLEAKKQLAALHFSQGDYQQAQVILLQSIEQFPNEGALKLMLARLYVAQNKPNQALNILTAFQPTPDSSIEYVGYRAALGQQLNKITLAIIDYQTLTKIDPQNAKWWLGLGITHDKVADVNNALQAYQKAQSIGTLDSSVEAFINTRISVLTDNQ